MISRRPPTKRQGASGSSRSRAAHTCSSSYELGSRFSFKRGIWGSFKGDLGFLVGWYKAGFELMWSCRGLIGALTP